MRLIEWIVHRIFSLWLLACVGFLIYFPYMLVATTPKGYVYGTVIAESGTIVDRQAIVESSTGALFGNESVRFGDPTYAIQFIADDNKIYFFSICSYSSSLLEAYALAINEGTKIRIPRSAFLRWLTGKVGKLYNDELEVL